MPKRPLPDSQYRKEQRFPRWMAGVAVGLVLIATLLALVLFLIG